MEELRDRDVVLMARHGLCAVGKTIEDAHKVAKATEDMSKLQYEVLQIGKPNPLLDGAYERFMKSMKRQDLM